jgi:phage repressor protein C with HTH and peptisase S24 domain
MESLGSRLQHLREPLTQEEFALKVEVAKNSLARYERNERNPDAAFFQKLFELGFNPNWVLTGVGSPRGGIVEVEDTDTSRFKMPKVESQAPREFDPGDYVAVRRYDVRLSAGKGRINEVAEHNGWLLFSRKFLDFADISQQESAIVRIKGDSMEPLIADGDTVLIDQRDCALTAQPKSGKRRCYAICRVSDGDFGALQCKFVHLELASGSEIAVVSSANDQYPPERVPVAELRVVGRVRWHGHTWF